MKDFHTVLGVNAMSDHGGILSGDEKMIEMTMTYKQMIWSLTFV